MSDSLQSFVHTFAMQNPSFSALAVFAANYLLFAMVVAFGLIGLLNLKKLTWGLVARAGVALVLTLVLTQILGRLVIDVRPYIAEHYTPLAHVATDNGFPSDHTLVAALLSGFLIWLERRWLAVFAVLTLVIGLGRMAIGAHHSLDIVGSLLIAVVSLAIAGWLPLKEAIFQRQVVPPKEA